MLRNYDWHNGHCQDRRRKLLNLTYLAWALPLVGLSLLRCHLTRRECTGPNHMNVVMTARIGRGDAAW